MISFFPFPYPVVTPLGEGYAVYVSSNPMWENDSWCVQLDDGRILHFSTNQLRGVPNGTYDIAPPAKTWKHDCVVTGGSVALEFDHCGACGKDRCQVEPKERAAEVTLMHYAHGTGTACGAGGDASTDPTRTTCPECHKLTPVPDDQNPLFARKPEPPPRPPLVTLKKWSSARAKKPFVHRMWNMGVVASTQAKCGAPPPQALTGDEHEVTCPDCRK